MEDLRIASAAGDLLRKVFNLFENVGLSNPERGSSRAAGHFGPARDFGSKVTEW